MQCTEIPLWTTAGDIPGWDNSKNAFVTLLPYSVNHGKKSFSTGHCNICSSHFNKADICCLLGHSLLLKILTYKIVIDVNRETLSQVL